MNDFSNFLKDAHKLNNIDLYQLILNECWKLWNKTDIEKSETSFNQYHHLLSSHSGQIAAIVLTWGNLESKNLSTTYDLGLLLKKYLEINESFSSDPQEIEKFHQDLVSYKSEEKLENKDLFKELNHNISQDLHLQSFMSRLMTSQWSQRSLTGRSAVRIYCIFEIFYNSVSDDQQQKIKAYFNMEPIHVFRSMYGIVAYLSHSEGNTNTGFIKKDEILKKGNIKEGFDMLYEDISNLAERISWDIDELRSYTRKILGKENPDIKYFESPFAFKPLIRHSDSKNVIYSCPDPWMLNAKFQNIFSDYFSDISSDPSETGRFREHWGQAFHKFAITFTKNIIPIDTLVIEPEAIGGGSPYKQADLILIKNEFALIIEFKTTIGGHDKQEYFAPESIAKIVDLQASALDQCHQTFNNFDKHAHNLNVKKFAYLVVTLKKQILKNSFINSFVSQSQYFISRKYQPFLIVDFDKFEELLTRYSTSEICDLISQVYDLSKKNQKDKVESILSTKNVTVSYYDEINKRIFPR